MSDREDGEALIYAIKAKTAMLEWDDDYIAMDKACGEIDTLMYRLRQLVLAPKRKPHIEDWLAELEKEIEDGI